MVLLSRRKCGEETRESENGVCLVRRNKRAEKCYHCPQSRFFYGRKKLLDFLFKRERQWKTETQRWVCGFLFFTFCFTLLISIWYFSGEDWLSECVLLLVVTAFTGEWHCGQLAHLMPDKTMRLNKSSSDSVSTFLLLCSKQKNPEWFHHLCSFLLFSLFFYLYFYISVFYFFFSYTFLDYFIRQAVW